ncbi:MAG: hypothetical protein JST54_11940 [Deltaproteobacteria bacterium]|nr:hypothetical protein [Deltaproteobacteria bacterium]
MIQRAPAQAPCAQHPGNEAAWICPRCGAFMCQSCERRTRPDAQPMCPACWGFRTEAVGPQKPEKVSTALQTSGLVLGCIAVLPLPGLQIAALIVTVLGIARAKQPETLAVRWRSVTGLCLTGLGLLVDVIFYGFLIH